MCSGTGRRLGESTREDYGTALDRHARGFFVRAKLAAIEPRDRKRFTAELAGKGRERPRNSYATSGRNLCLCSRNLRCGESGRGRVRQLVMMGFPGSIPGVGFNLVGLPCRDGARDATGGRFGYALARASTPAATMWSSASLNPRRVRPPSRHKTRPPLVERDPPRCSAQTGRFQLVRVTH